MRNGDAVLDRQPAASLTEAVAALGSEGWSAVRLTADKGSSLKPHVPLALQLPLPLRALQDLTPGCSAEFHFPHGQRPALSYARSAALQLGLPGFEEQGPPPAAPESQHKGWAQFLQQSREVVQRSLAQRCRRPQYAWTTACGKLAQGAAAPVQAPTKKAQKKKPQDEL